MRDTDGHPGGREAEQCVACGGAAGYNRAVVDTVADELVGGLCLECERSAIDAPIFASERGVTCATCSRDGFFALPKWRIYPTRKTETGQLSVGYAVQDDTVRLCDRHFQQVATAFDPDQEPPAIGRERYREV